MMSSATSIDRRRPGLQSPPEESDQKTRSADAGFQVWHFFVLLSLIAATVAVIMTRDNTPQHLILLSLAVGGVGLAAYAVYRMVAPFAFPEGTRAAEPIGERLRADLEREKSLVLRSIKELEFDRAMGKLSARDFEEMSGRLRARAIGIIKQLDSGGYRDIIERDLAARIGRSPSRPPADRPAAPPAAPAKQTGLCGCGVQNDQDARFCKACGSRLEAA
jgi:hypothetical protein